MSEGTPSADMLTVTTTIVPGRGCLFWAQDTNGLSAKNKDGALFESTIGAILSSRVSTWDTLAYYTYTQPSPKAVPPWWVATRGNNGTHVQEKWKDTRQV